MVWGEKWEGGSGLGTRVHPWQIHVDVWQNQYSIVKLKKKKRRLTNESGQSVLIVSYSSWTFNTYEMTQFYKIICK